MACAARVLRSLEPRMYLSSPESIARAHRRRLVSAHKLCSRAPTLFRANFTNQLLALLPKSARNTHSTRGEISSAISRAQLTTFPFSDRVESTFPTHFLPIARPSSQPAGFARSLSLSLSLILPFAFDIQAVLNFGSLIAVEL